METSPVSGRSPEESMSAEISQNDKQKDWQRESDRLDRITRERGDDIGIETRIRDAVVALNLLGVLTTQSCAGHMERFRVPTPPFINFNSASRQKMELLLHEFYEGKTITDDGRRITIKPTKSGVFFDSFGNQEIDPTGLKIESEGVGNLGGKGIFSSPRSIRERFQKCIVYSNEMNKDFSDFLKNKYFQG